MMFYFVRTLFSINFLFLSRIELFTPFYRVTSCLTASAISSVDNAKNRSGNVISVTLTAVRQLLVGVGKKEIAGSVFV